MTAPTREPGPRVIRALEQLRQPLAPTLDAAWLAQTRDAFVAGTLVAVPKPARSAIQSFWPALAAAAALAILFALPARGPQWQWVASTGEGPVRVGDVSIPIQDSLALSRALVGGADVIVPEGSQLDVALPGVVLLQITGGTHSTLPRQASFWNLHELRSTLTSGELRATTGADFHGTRLAFQSPGTSIWVTGTTLAVIRGADSTCVCVFEGRVAVRSSTGVDTVFAGTRRVIPDGSKAARVEAIRPMETMKLSMLRARSSEPPSR